MYAETVEFDCHGSAACPLFPAAEMVTDELAANRVAIFAASKELPAIETLAQADKAIQNPSTEGTCEALHWSLVAGNRRAAEEISCPLRFFVQYGTPPSEQGGNQ